MQSTIMAEWLSEEREVKLIDMCQARPALYEVISKEHSNRNKRMLVVLACNMWLCLRSAILHFRLSLLPPASLTP